MSAVKRSSPFFIVFLFCMVPFLWAAEPASPSASELNNQAISEVKAGRLEEAVSLLRKAFSMDSSDPQIRRNFSLALTDFAVSRVDGGGEISRAFDLLEEAVEINADNGLAWIRLGDLYYLERNNFSRAVSAWQRAYGLVPGAQWQTVAARIAQAQRDESVERLFSVEATEHFQVRFPSPDYRPKALHVGSVLEREYRYLSQELGEIPTRVTVILYRVGEFQKVNSRFDWAVGFYDGRIRMRVEDVHTPREAAILTHELAHAFLHKIYGARLPVWVHEGFAQHKEPKRKLSEHEQEIMKGLKTQDLWVPLKGLDVHFQQPVDLADVERAYLEARLVLEELLRKQGIESFKKFLKALSAGEPVSSAFDRSFAPLLWSQVDQGRFE